MGGQTAALAGLGSVQAWMFGLTAVLLLLLAATARLWYRLSVAERRYGQLAQGVRGENLASLLERHLGRVQALEVDAAALRAALERLADRQRGGLQHIGLVRYDAFAAVGGCQSFALAVVDDHGDGFVINSLFGREGSSTYAKPVRGGRSDIGLAEEEAEALTQALAVAGRGA